jgi:hypothetical protein
LNPKSTYLTKLVIFGTDETLTGLKNGHFQQKQAYDIAFLLHIGYIGLKCPFLTQKEFVGLKRGILSKPAFLDSFSFHYRNIFCYR